MAGSKVRSSRDARGRIIAKNGAVAKLHTLVTSWGRLGAKPHAVAEPAFRDQAQAALAEGGSILGFGLGRSYGDVCLNSDGRCCVHTIARPPDLRPTGRPESSAPRRA